MSTLATHIPRTLIADDQPDVVAALRLLLKGAGFQTEAANSPKAVLEAIRNGEFDVALIDLNYARDTTSGKEGLDLISRILAEDNSLPIVVMTAWGTIELAVEVMRRGVRDFVEKPWENARLLEVLRTQIDEGRIRRQRNRKSVQRRQLNRTLQRELKEAREIQRRMMPSNSIVFDGVEIASAWRPARTIGGDYLAAFPIDEEQIALCAADVSGKGLPAALLMSNLHAAFTSSSLQGLGTHDVCAQLNQSIYASTPLNRFVSSFYGVLDLRSRSLRFTNAGHNPPLLIRSNGEVARLESGGRVLGAFANSIYTQQEIDLNSGDRLFLFTDGVTEARNSAGEELGEEKLFELFAQERRRSARELRTIIMDYVTGFCSQQFDDDAAVMVLAAN